MRVGETDGGGREGSDVAEKSSAKPWKLSLPAAFAIATYLLTSKLVLVSHGLCSAGAGGAPLSPTAAACCLQSRGSGVLPRRYKVTFPLFDF